MEGISISGASKGFHDSGFDAGSPGPRQINNTAQLDGFIAPEDSAKVIQGNSFDRLPFHLPEIRSESETLLDDIFAELPPELPQIPKAPADSIDALSPFDMGYLSNIISVGETKPATSYPHNTPVSSSLHSYEGGHTSLLNVESERKNINTAEARLERSQEAERDESPYAAPIKHEFSAVSESKQGNEVRAVPASNSPTRSYGALVSYAGLASSTSSSDSSPTTTASSGQSSPTTLGSWNTIEIGRAGRPSAQSAHGKPGLAETLLQKLGLDKKLKSDIALGIRQYNALQNFCGQLRNAGAYLVQSCSELQARNNALSAENAEMRNSGAYLMQGYNELQAQNQVLADENGALRRNIINLETENRGLDGHVDNYRAALQNAQAAHAGCINEAQALTREIADQTTQHADLARRMRIKHGRRAIVLRLQVDRTERRAQDLEDALVEERSEREDQREELAEKVAGLRRSLSAMEIQLSVQDDSTNGSSEYDDALEYQTGERWSFFAWLRKPWAHQSS